MNGVEPSPPLSGSLQDVESSPSFLAVIIDLHADSWVQHSPNSIWAVLPKLLVFMNAHLALHCLNDLAILGYNSVGAKLLHSTVGSAEPGRYIDKNYEVHANTTKLEGSMIRQFKNLDTKVLEVIKSQIEEANEKAFNLHTSVAGPLALALTYLNRQTKQLRSRGHILIVSASPDNMGSKYIPSMNSIFTAQKLRIPIDSAIVGAPNSFLQQAADFTEGSYLEIDSLENLLQTLISVFLVDPGVRPLLNLATKPDVDFSAVCFLTAKVIDIGLVCSVCLCIMASMPKSRQCPVCHTKYDL